MKLACMNKLTKLREMHFLIVCNTHSYSILLNTLHSHSVWIVSF